MLSLGAERTDVAWGVVNQTMSDHFVLSLEALAAFGSIAGCDRAVVGPNLGVYVCVRAMIHR